MAGFGFSLWILLPLMFLTFIVTVSAGNLLRLHYIGEERYISI